VGSSYGALMRVRGFPGLVASLFLGRVAGQMLSIALILFVLYRYHSPQLAGLAVFLLTIPGLITSPIAGALLDRYGRTRLMTVDYLVAAAALSLMAGLSLRHLLPPALLLVICAVASFTGPLSVAGARAMTPSLVPVRMWERANALDGTAWLLARILGAPLAGVLVGYVGPEWALAVTAAVFVGAGASISRVLDPAPPQRGAGIMAEAWSGLVYVLRNRTLSGLALTFFFYSLGWGCLTIAVPVMVLGRFHQGPAVVGSIWGAVAVAGMVSSLIVGRVRTEGRERQLISGSIAAVAIAMTILPFANSVVVVMVALVVVALVETPWDISFLTLRQRRTDPARFGRVFAISVSLNMIGGPVGSALAGPLIAWSISGAIWFAVAAVLTAALFPILVIPGEARLVNQPAHEEA